MQSITITQPDDWHVHLRDEAALTHTVKASAAHFSRALVMPNLSPALTTVSTLIDYRQRILAALPQDTHFNPLMTLYINESISPDELLRASEHAFIKGAKLYPKGATTHSQEGPANLKTLYPLFEVMQQLDLVLQIHGESTQGDIFDREKLFLNESLVPLMRQFPKLRIVLEHISTQAAVDFVTAAPNTLAATITPHHLYYHRNHLLAGGIRPHYYCLPILKRETDLVALQQAATSGNPKFFAGTDSAPHPQTVKESACGCAGIYSAPYAVPLYTQLFDILNQLPKLNAFMGQFGANFYQVPINDKQLTLHKTPQMLPYSLPFADKQRVVPMEAGNTLSWSVHDIQ